MLLCAEQHKVRRHIWGITGRVFGQTLRLHSYTVRGAGPTGSPAPHVQTDDWKMSDTHRCANTKTHTAVAVQSLSNSGLHLWSRRADALDRKLDCRDPEEGYSSANSWDLSSSPKSSPCKPHRLSSLIEETPPHKEAEIHTHMQQHTLMKDIRQSETWSGGTT